MKKLIIAFFLLGFFLFNIKFLAGEESYVRIEPVKEVKVEAKIQTKIKSVKSNKSKVRQLTEAEQKEIDRIFGSKAEIATAVLKHESGLRVDAINHNCKYNGKSTFCRKGDTKITSSDCGLGQINVKAKTCPAELLTSEGNLKAIEKVYNSQGLQAWASFNNKSYIAFMK